MYAMKSRIMLLSSIVAFSIGHSAASAQSPPADWIDPATGHRIIRLSGDGGGSSLYFHQNSYAPKGDKLIFNTRAGVVAIDLTKLGVEPVNAEIVAPVAHAIAAAWRPPDVYFMRSGALHAANLETKVTRKVASARGVVNADETLVIAAVYDADAPAKVKELGLPMQVTADLAPRDVSGGRLKPGGRSLALVVTDIKTGTANKIHYSTEWL